MTRVFALADLHLSLSGAKPMDVFGELWRDHTSRMARAWDGAVGSEDWVLLPGDLSWARNADEAREDLAWIAARPGRKLLLRGNHDSWWPGPAKLRRILPEGCHALHNDAFDLGDWVVVGARGWTSPDDPHAVEGDGKIFRRELHRLGLSIADAERRFGSACQRLAMVHFPPRLKGRPSGEVDALLRSAGVRVCLYGHLHGEDHALALRGEVDGLDYRFVAADAVDFTPVPIEGPGEA